MQNYMKAIVSVVAGIAAVAAQHFLGVDAAAVGEVGASVGGDSTLIAAISGAATALLVYFVPNRA